MNFDFLNAVLHLTGLLMEKKEIEFVGTWIKNAIESVLFECDMEFTITKHHDEPIIDRYTIKLIGNK